jgi:drug/metabolite transporter (DMT)-like permease
MAIKIGLTDSPPFLSSAFRFLISSAFLLILAYIKKIPFPNTKRDWIQISLPGFFAYFISYALVYWGEQYIDPGLAAILFATMPFFVAIFAHILLVNERLNFVKILSLLIGFLGVIIIFGKSFNNANNNMLGMSCFIVAASSSAFSGVLTKKNLHAINPIMIAGVQMFLGTIFLIILAFWVEDLDDFRITLKSISALLYLSFLGSVLAFVIYFWLLKKIEATKLSIIAFVCPVVALVLSYFFMNEKITLNLLLGSFFVLVGIVLLYGFGKQKNGGTNG